MSLFPAYAHNGEEPKAEAKDVNKIVSWNIDENEIMGGEIMSEGEVGEAALLASSESGEEDQPPARPELPSGPALAPAPRDFYFDGKADNANLGVSTLYYPGRPIYKRVTKEPVGGSCVSGGGAGGRRRRYYQQAGAPRDAERDARELEARRGAFRLLVRGSPRDAALWLGFVRFEEEWGDGADWLAACEEAVRTLAPASSSAGAAALRAELYRARRATRSHAQLVQDLTADLQAAESVRCRQRRLEQWLRLAWALAEGGAPSQVERVVLAALQDLPHDPQAYPHLFYVYGAVLRAAGLWEQLVLLVELACAVNYPASSAFPPAAPSAEAAAAAEESLQRAEDEALASNLPLQSVWARVERLRAARHWRPASGPALDADPQRAPSAAEAAPLLRAVPPAGSLLMCVAMLRLAQVPLLPASEATRAAWGGAEGAEEGDGLAAALPALLRARRRLHGRAGRAGGGGAAAAAALRRSLPALLDPPHLHCDAAGYASWASALWDACLGWTAGRARLALACWRLRWLAALALLAEADEARRLRALARRVLRDHAPAQPVAYALFARMEADAGDEAAATRVALQAVRAACGDADVPREHALFCARVLREVAGRGAVDLCDAALCAAVRGDILPREPAAPAPADMRDALRACEQRCAELEARLESGGGGGEGEGEAEAAVLCAALTCGAGEWQAARVALLGAEARAAELALPPRSAAGAPSAAAVAWREARALALATAAGLTRASLRLHPAFPNNALLALAYAERPAWCGGAAAGGLAGALPALLDAPLDGSASAAGVRRLARAAARAGRRADAEGAALAVLRLEAEARAALPPHRALFAALQLHCNHKWLYVRGGGWLGAEGAALGEALLERGLRAHALLPELRALLPPPRSSDGLSRTGSY